VLNPQEQWEVQQLVATTKKEYKNKLRSHNNSIFAINLISDLHLKVDHLVTEVKNIGVRFGCEKGCSYCCTLRVEALAPEVFYIAKKLKSNLSSEQLLELTDKLKIFSDKAKGLSQIEHEIPCPMLAEGKCTIYEYRPAMCRKFNSLDAEVCKDPFAEVPEHKGVAVKSAANMHGVMEAYSNNKLSATPHELGQALLIAVTDNSAEKRWFKGARVFTPLPEVN
jgi:Fe-S-cluster containining protein